MDYPGQPSSAKLFPSLDDQMRRLTEDTGNDLVLRHRGANQFLGNDAAHHDDRSTVGPRGNRVQDGALSLINATSPLGRPTRANPTGGQTS